MNARHLQRNYLPALAGKEMLLKAYSREGSDMPLRAYWAVNYTFRCVHSVTNTFNSPDCSLCSNCHNEPKFWKDQHRQSLATIPMNSCCVP